MKACEYILNQMHINKMEDEYFVDNIVRRSNYHYLTLATSVLPN